MHRKWPWVVVVAVAALSLSSGFASQAKKPAPKPRPAKEARRPLPDWAPANPSPEFLRAWQVLKPVPTETGSGEASKPEEVAMMARIRSTWPAIYEFFGTMSDKQIAGFLSKKELRIPVKSLTTKQRAALNRWFEAYRKAMKGVAQDPVPEDYLVKLYKEGATEDLSNVDVGFATIPITISDSGAESTHRVSIWLWVRLPKGGSQQFGYPFAQL